MSAIPPGIIIDGASPETQVRNVRPGMGLALYGANSGCSGFRPAEDGDDIMWELPGADGTAGQFLQTNGDGTLSWVSMQTPGMLATPTVLRSPVALPAELLPLLVDTDGQTSTLDTVADYRSLLGLGTAATADVDDFASAGDAAAVAAALLSHEALTTTAHGGIASYGTGTDRAVPVRNGTGRDLTDSLLTIDATTGLASLRGTAAAYRAYGPTGVPYTSLSHDGTSGVLSTSSGDLTLSPASGITALAASQKIKWGAAGTGMQLSLTVGSNPQLNVRDHTDSYYARIRADTYYWNNGEFLYSDNAKMKFRKAFDAAYLPIWAGTLRAYDANTNYTELSHDGTNAVLAASSGQVGIYRNSTLCAQTNNAGGLNVYTRFQLMDGGSTLYGFFDPAATNTFKFGSGVGIGWASTAAASGAVDAAFERVAANVVGINNGTAGQRAALYTGTHRVYDQSANTNYLTLSHDGTNAYLTPSTGAVYIAANATVGGSEIRYLPGGVSRALLTTSGWQLASNYVYGFSSTTSVGTTDTAFARRSGGGGIESNNGTAGTLRDVYARTFYGVAQASTDVALCAQAHASQASTSPILKVITSAGGDLFRVLPDRTVVGPDMTLDLPASSDGASATGRNGIRTGYGAMYLKSGNTDNLVVSANLLQIGGGGMSTTIQCADRGSSLTLNVIDGYGNANTAGKDLIYQAGRPTGNAVGGAHRFKVAPSPGVSGTTFGTLADTVVIDGTNGTTGALTATALAVGSTPLVSKGAASQTAPYWEGQTSVGTRGPHISSTAPSVTADCAGALRFGTLGAFIGFNSTDWLVYEGGSGSLVRHQMVFGTAMQNRFTTGGHFSAQDPTDGFKLGTSASQLIGLWGTTPIAQPTTAVASATRVAGGGTTTTDTDTYDGYTLGQVVRALRNFGVLA